jgi:hypothetical protein
MNSGNSFGGSCYVEAMKQVRVVALTDHSPDGSNRYRKGDVYVLSESSARLLVKLNMVRIEEDDSAKAKGRYNRRDMRAES